MLSESSISFPIEKDPFDEAECTKTFALHAMDAWIRTRNNAKIPPFDRAKKAQAFFHWFIARDYVITKDATGSPIPRRTPEGQQYLIEHRLLWLAPGVRISPMETVSPKLAVEIAYDDYINFIAKDKADQAFAERNARKAEATNPPKRF